MKRSEFINLLMAHSPEEDIEIMFLGDGGGDIVINEFGYHEIVNDDIDTVIEDGKIIGLSISTY